ncbi:amidohydrolase family protein [Candidatus Bathyarchaeota archaeon]|nr:amidohydrolase family protein [Candidatus Bathyarchaeota archaeon]
MVIIDGHTHFAGPGRGFPPNTVGDLLSVMDRNGIDAFVTCAPFSSIGEDRTYDEVNGFIAESMKAAPDRIIGFIRVNPHLQDHALRSIRVGVEEQGFRGVKFHPRNEAFAINSEELSFPLADLAAKLRVPILIHTGDPDTYGFAEPTLVGDLADAFPDLTLIIGHMGKRLFEDAILVARWFENIVLETSFRNPRDIARAVKCVGAERIVYGSDMPFGVPEIEMMKVRICDITAEEKEMVLGANMARILDLEVGK